MKKTMFKAAASTLVLTMGLSVVPLPAFAVSSNIVAETENQNTLTISQIQDLAVIYNDTAKKLQLSRDQLDHSQQMLRNQRRTLQNSINSMDSYSGGDSATIQQAMKELAAQLTANGKDPETDAQYQALKIQYASAVASEQSMAASIQSSLDSAVSSLDQMDDSIDDLDNNKDDLDKSMKDLQTQMRYTAANLSLNVIQLNKSIELLEDQISLANKSVQISELQNKLGMNIETDIEAQKASKKEAEKNLEDAKESLSTIKRAINVLIGRNAGNPLEIVAMNLPVAIDPAPAYTQDLIDKFVSSNYTLKTLDRDITDLKDSIDDASDSDERKTVDYQVEGKKQDIKTQKQAVEDNLKALLAKIDSDGEAYQVSRQKYVTEKKNFSYTQKKYELGMISEVQLRSAELSLKNAELTNMKNGYAFYMDWQKYYAAEKGVDMTSL